MAARIVIPYWDEQFLGPYARAVRREGAEVVAVPMATSPEVEPALADADGLLLVGGGDVEPRHYGSEDPQGLCLRIMPERDRFEIPAARHAVAHDLPLLAICRGHQVLAVACGGTLHMDIAAELPGSEPHRREKTDLDVHAVTLAAGSRVAQVMGTTRIVTNSRHHQAVRALQPGEGLVVTGLAADGVVEVLEAPGRDFVVGVQWHPETFVGADDRFAPLFRELVTRAAARRRAAG